MTKQKALCKIPRLRILYVSDAVDAMGAKRDAKLRGGEGGKLYFLFPCYWWGGGGG